MSHERNEDQNCFALWNVGLCADGSGRLADALRRFGRDWSRVLADRGRNALSMALAFPAVVFYGISLFGIGAFLHGEKRRKTWFIMTSFGLTPWLCVHLFVVGTLYLFAWLRGSAWAVAAMPAAEALRSQFGWVVWISYPFMLPPYFYWAWLIFKGKSVFPKWMAISNPITLYLVLKGVSLLIPVSAFRLAFTNGLMSEAMFLWFLSMMILCSFKQGC